MSYPTLNTRSKVVSDIVQRVRHVNVSFDDFKKHPVKRNCGFRLLTKKVHLQLSSMDDPFVAEKDGQLTGYTSLTGLQSIPITFSVGGLVCFRAQRKKVGMRIEPDVYQGKGTTRLVQKLLQQIFGPIDRAVYSNVSTRC